MRKNARMIVKGHFNIFTNCNIWLNENSELILGSGNINNGLNMSCFQKIEIGDNATIAENVTIRDSDNHYLDKNCPNTAPIKIGDGVWIGMNSMILKGVTIGDGAVIAAGSVVNRDIPARCLAAGVPAKIKKNEISWSR
ncbi:acyltransferase [Acidobacteriota bacterium]